jgi:DnaJ-class molecular chaperone
MTAKIYLFRRADGKVFRDAVSTLTDMGYKLEHTASGKVQALPADEWVTCPFCNGLGSVSAFGGGFEKCTKCDGIGVY